MNNTANKIYEFIVQHSKEKGFPPTYREIGNAVGLASSSTVSGHIQRLVKKGLIIHSPTSPRSIKIVGDTFESEVKVLDRYLSTPSTIEWQGRLYELSQAEVKKLGRN